VLYKRFAIEESYLVPRYAALCERPELLTVEEGQRLGMDIVIPLTRARECARNQGTSGDRSPSPAGLGGNELTDIIMDHFRIKPVQPPAEPQPPSPGKPDDSGAGAGDKTPGGNGGEPNTNSTNANGTNTNGTRTSRRAKGAAGAGGWAGGGWAGGWGT